MDVLQDGDVRGVDSRPMEGVTDVIAEHPVLHGARSVKPGIAEIRWCEIEVPLDLLSPSIGQCLELAGIELLNRRYLLRVVRATVEEERVASQRGKVRIGDVDRETSLQRRVSRNSPTLEHSALPPALHALQNGEFIGVVGHKAMTGIETRIPEVQPGDATVG